MNAWAWIPREHIKLETEADICNLSAPIGKWAVDTGENLQACKPASLVQQEALS